MHYLQNKNKILAPPIGGYLYLSGGICRKLNNGNNVQINRKCPFTNNNLRTPASYSCSNNNSNSSSKSL